MATLASALDYSLPEAAAEDSHNLLPLIQGHDVVPRETHVHNTREEAWAIRVGEWSLVVGEQGGYHTKSDSGWESKRGYTTPAPVEFYHYAKDPAQRDNLAKQHPEKVAELKEILVEIRESVSSAPRLIEAQ